MSRDAIDDFENEWAACSAALFKRDKPVAHFWFLAGRHGALVITPTELAIEDAAMQIENTYGMGRLERPYIAELIYASFSRAAEQEKE